MVLPRLDDFNVHRIQPERKVYIQPNKTLKQFKNDLYKYLLPSYSISLDKDKCHLWVTDSNPSDFLSYLSSKVISLSSYCKEKNTEFQDYNCGVEFPGYLSYKSMVKPNKLLIIEVPGSDNKCIFKKTKTFFKSECSNCLEERIIIIVCKCRLVLHLIINRFLIALKNVNSNTITLTTKDVEEKRK